MVATEIYFCGQHLYLCFFLSWGVNSCVVITGSGVLHHFMSSDVFAVHISRYIRQVSVRYGEIFHEPKASEISCHISQLTSVISALFL